MHAFNIPPSSLNQRVGEKSLNDHDGEHRKVMAAIPTVICVAVGRIEHGIKTTETVVAVILTRRSSRTLNLNPNT